MKILPNLIKDHKDEWLVKTTVSINRINPIIDRITEDESVESVILINEQGDPIFTNVSLVNATNFGRKIKPLGCFVMTAIKEVDVFDEAMVLRISTKKFEIMMVPHEDFGVIVVQYARKNKKKLTKTVLEAKYTS